MNWLVYLAGEVHSDWRNEIERAASDLPIEFCAPVTDHPASDGAGDHLPEEASEGFWRDHKSAKVNAIRTRTMIESADIVVVRFGEKYKQWNAAFDAGYAAASGKALIVMHPPEHTHALKEIDGAALAVCRTPDQVVQTLRYVTTQR